MVAGSNKASLFDLGLATIVAALSGHERNAGHASKGFSIERDIPRDRLAIVGIGGHGIAAENTQCRN